MEENFLRTCIKKWRWFAVSVASTLVLAVLFLLATAPRYERTASLLIKDEQGHGGLLSSMTGNMGLLGGLAGFNISSNVINEMEIMGSPAMMIHVIKRLDLDVKYQVYDGLMKKELWKETLPVKVTFPQLTDMDGAYMKMDLRKDGTFTLYKFRKNKDKMDGKVTGKVNTVCKTPLGKVSVIKTPYFERCFHDASEMTIRITQQPKFELAERILKTMDIGQPDDQTSIINISYEDQYAERAELIINTLVQAYHEEWLKDKQNAADASTLFINERLEAIEGELNGLDQNIADFRGKNLLPDYTEAAKMYLKNASLAYEAQMEANNRLYMMEQMRKQVKSVEGQNVVLPANLLPDNPNVALQISEYNKLQTKRNSMVENSNEQNPLVKDLDVQLDGMRNAIINSLDQGVSQLKALQRGVSSEDSKLKREMSAAPAKITQILPAERKQKIAEALYIYLLEKREENSMTHVFNAQNMRVVSPPLGKSKPVFPQKLWTLIASFLLGLFLPLSWFYFQAMRNEEKHPHEEKTADTI